MRNLKKENQPVSANSLNRRDFLRITASASAAVAGLSTIAFNQQIKPNILFIAIDDLNDYIGCMGGHPDAKTPNIDSLAAEGILFKHAYCDAPACLPSRFSLLTGTRPDTHGVRFNADTEYSIQEYPKYMLLPQYLKNNGYHTMGTGKIFHNWATTVATGRDVCWNEWNSDAGHALESIVKNVEERRNGVTALDYNAKGELKPNLIVDWGAIDVDPAETGDMKGATWAAGQLAKTWDKPFFLAVGLHKPHLPWYIPKKYFEDHPLENIDLPQVKMDDLDDCDKKADGVNAYVNTFTTIRDAEPANFTKWREGVQAYLAAGTFADDCVGTITKALKNSQYADNTIVILWSDHGWHLGEKIHWQKFTLWEEATKNPVILAGPGIAKGEPCDRTVNLVDVYPTILELCGLERVGKLEGHSLKPLLTDPGSQWKYPAISTWGKGQFAIRTEEWRYIIYANGSEELYDHRIGTDDKEVDENEWTNLAYQPGYESIKESLRKYIPSVGVKPSDGTGMRRPLPGAGLTYCRNDILYISGGTNESLHNISLFASDGKKVFSADRIPSAVRLPASIPTGMYMLLVSDRFSTYRQSVFVQ